MADLADIERQLKFFPSPDDNPQRLTGDDIRRFNEYGCLFPLEVFNESEALANQDYFDRLARQATAHGWNSYSINGWQSFCAGIHDLATEPRLLDLMQDLLGEDVICLGTHFFCKLPGDAQQVSWHQDAAYWPLTPSKVITVWLAIDDVDEANGAMQIIPRSHLHGPLRHFPSEPGDRNVLSYQVPEAVKYGDAPVSVCLKKGQVSLHSDLALHSSRPNPSPARRCGLVLRYLPADVRAYHEWNKGSIICRGKDPTAHWANHPRPDGDWIPDKPTGNVEPWNLKPKVRVA